MKRTFQKLMAIMLAITIFCTCIPEISAQASSYSDFATGQMLIVTAPDGVNMHLAPTTASARVMTLGQGNHLYVDQINYQTGWMKVTCGGHTGWVLGADGWFGTYNATPAVYSYSQKMQARVLATALNVHTTPVKLNSNIIDDLYTGQVVDALGYTNTGWTKVSYYRGSSLIVGYVYSAWVSVTAKTSTSTIPEKFTTIYGYSAAVKSSCEALNVHCSPSIDADIITDIYSGDVVNILAQSKSWYKISLNIDGNMRVGYIYRSYTNKKDAMENLRLSVSSKTLKKGKKYHILVRGNTGMSLKTTWKSGNKKVAKVSKTGYVTAKKKGTAKITCTVKVGKRTKKLTCRIKVK